MDLRRMLAHLFHIPTPAIRAIIVATYGNPNQTAPVIKWFQLKE